VVECEPQQTMTKPKIVVIGGGTGSFIVLSGLKSYPVQLSTIVTMMDSGGSTGKLRDQLGVLPPGDLRQALVALSESELIWRKLFTYRFDNGDLDGHSFGNLFLSALEKITGSTEKAISYATELLKTRGEVIPVTLENTVLCAKYADGTTLEGETKIDNATEPRARINYMYLHPTAQITPNAKEKIQKADYLIFGPGDLYTSIIPNLLVDGVTEAIHKSKAKKIMLVNLMTKLGQTDCYRASDFVSELCKYLGGVDFDYIFVNNKRPPKALVDWYRRSGDAEVVKDDLGYKKSSNAKIIRADLLSKTKYEQSLSDRIKRSLIRHDPEKVARALIKVVRK
jgi:uncharacterized cofD-like protein